MDFEWDFQKEQANQRKHGFTFAVALECFYDPKGLEFFDLKHSEVEKRWYWVGKANSGEILTVWYTKRGPVIRIIGCAKWRKFRKLYETTQIK